MIGKPCWDQGFDWAKVRQLIWKVWIFWCDVAELTGLYGRMVDGLHIWLFSQGYSKWTPLSRHKMSLLRSTNLSRARATARLFMYTFWRSWIAKLLTCRRNAAFCEKLREVLKIPRKCFDWKKGALRWFFQITFWSTQEEGSQTVRRFPHLVFGDSKN